MTPITAEGKPFLPEERRHYCFNHPDFRYYANRVINAMAAHYEGCPDIIGWQIDNELDGEEFICYCAYCRTAFQKWLAAKYGDISDLNRWWGGAFFSLEFKPGTRFRSRWAMTYDFSTRR
jgi:beta-galactosidase GanA